MPTLTLKTKRFCTEYDVSEFPADGGRGFNFEKLTNGSDRTQDAYEVFIAAPGSGEFDSCSCRGAERYGRCKHQDAARKIIAEKPVAPVAPVIDPAEALDALTALLFGKPTPKPFVATLPGLCPRKEHPAVTRYRAMNGGKISSPRDTADQERF